MTDFKFGAVKIDPTAYGSQGSAILGIRDSGKTYTGTELAERVFEAGIPFTAFDPIGVWRFLRVPGHGRGYPVVVAGGQAGDLPLTVASAPEYVRAAMRDGVSLIIDLFDINLSKADWKRIVTACVRVMMHENSKYGLRHVYIEEAAEFVPQRVGPDQGQVYAEVEKLARMGGNSRLGYTLINQRAEEVNKAVLELCDNLFLHRQKGRNSLTALSKWLDIGNVKDHREIIDSLSTLPTGECWAWLAGSERPIRVKVPVKNSLHPDRRVMRGDGDIKVKTAVDVGTFVTSMRSSLGKIEEEAKANDPVALRKQIADLQRQIKTASPAAGASKAELAAEYQRGLGDAEILMREARGERGAELRRASAALMEGAQALSSLSIKMDTDALALPVTKVPHRAAPKPGLNTVNTRLQPAAKVPHNGDARLNRPQQIILDQLAVLKDRDIYPASRATLAAFCKVSPSSSGYEKNLSTLKTMGMLDYPQQGVVALTRDGEACAAAPFDDGTPPADFWLAIVNEPKAKILRALIDAHPRQLGRVAIASVAGVSDTSSGFEKNLSQLKTLGAIDYPMSGVVALTRHVMPA